MDKLERHEVRERQLGEQLTRSLASLEKRTRGEEKNIENIASFIARIDDKVKHAQATIEKVKIYTLIKANWLINFLNMRLLFYLANRR